MAGLYRISQGGNFLSQDNGIAVTMPLNIGGAFVWQLGPPPNDAIGPPLTFSLLTNAGIPDPGLPVVPPVLTLGPDGPGVGAVPVLVLPAVPGGQNQLWVVQLEPLIVP